MGYGRHFILLILFAGSASARLAAQSQPLVVERDGATLRVSAPQLMLLAGKPLEQLHNGASVAFVFDLTLTPAQEIAPAIRVKERFIFSYDLWEEKFTVVQSNPPGRSASQMTADTAVSWCLDSMRVGVQSLSPAKTFMIKLECWTTSDVADASDSDNGSSLTLAGLVDVFSRKGHNPPPRWMAVAGPLRLGDVKEKKKPKT